jgi:HD-like signal output (HDOD) protein
MDPAAPLRCRRGERLELKLRDLPAVIKRIDARPPGARPLQTTPTMPLITHPLPSVQAYIDALSGAGLPVLRHTVRALDALREGSHQPGARELAAVVLTDPLMTLRLLTYLEAHRRASQTHDITTIERALMMLGIEPFFAAFASLPTVEDTLAAHPKALVVVIKLIARARHAAEFARDFAVMRRDHDVQEITVATLLREATEIVCSIHAPTLTLAAIERQLAELGRPAAEAQRAVFGVTAAELQHALVVAWRLPALLTDLLEGGDTDDPRVRTVRLAARFARHQARGWTNPALEADVIELEGLLHHPREMLLQRLGMPAEVRAALLPSPTGA